MVYLFLFLFGLVWGWTGFQLVLDNLQMCSSGICTIVSECVTEMTLCFYNFIYLFISFLFDFSPTHSMVNLVFWNLGRIFSHISAPTSTKKCLQLYKDSVGLQVIDSEFVLNNLVWMHYSFGTLLGIPPYILNRIFIYVLTISTYNVSNISTNLS